MNDAKRQRSVIFFFFGHKLYNKFQTAPIMSYIQTCLIHDTAAQTFICLLYTVLNGPSNTKYMQCVFFHLVNLLRAMTNRIILVLVFHVVFLFFGNNCIDCQTLYSEETDRPFRSASQDNIVNYLLKYYSKLQTT